MKENRSPKYTTNRSMHVYLLSVSFFFFHHLVIYLSLHVIGPYMFCGEYHLAKKILINIEQRARKSLASFLVKVLLMQGGPKRLGKPNQVYAQQKKQSNKRNPNLQHRRAARRTTMLAPNPQCTQTIILILKHRTKSNPEIQTVDSKTCKENQRTKQKKEKRKKREG